MDRARATNPSQRVSDSSSSANGGAGRALEYDRTSFTNEWKQLKVALEACIEAEEFDVYRHVDERELAKA